MTSPASADLGRGQRGLRHPSSRRCGSASATSLGRRHRRSGRIVRREYGYDGFRPNFVIFPTLGSPQRDRITSSGRPRVRSRRRGAQKRLGERNQRATSDAEKHTGDECVPVAPWDEVVADATGCAVHCPTVGSGSPLRHILAHPNRGQPRPGHLASTRDPILYVHRIIIFGRRFARSGRWRACGRR